MFFTQLLRYINIVLVMMILGVLVFLSYCALNKKFGPERWTRAVILTILFIAGALGSFVASVDLVFFAEPIVQTVEVHMSGVVTAAEGEALFNPYWDVTGTSLVTNVEWGQLEPGETSTVQFWIKNEGTTDLYCVIVWDSATWQPPNAEQFFTLSWNYGENPLSPNRARRVTLSLLVNEDISGIEEFSFDMMITGSDTAPGGG